MTRLAIIPLGLLAAALAGVLFLETRPDAPAVDAVAPRAAPAVSPPGQPAPGPDRIGPWVATILARPLFEPSRRPPAVEAAAGGAIAVLPRVTGVLVGPTGRSVIFAGSGNGRPLVAREGTRVGPFTVQSIDIGAVTILGPDGPRVLHPSFDTAAGTTAGSPAAAAPAPPVAPVTGARLIGSGLPSIPGLPQIPGAPALPPLQLPGGLIGVPGFSGLPAGGLPASNPSAPNPSAPNLSAPGFPPAGPGMPGQSTAAPPDPAAPQIASNPAQVGR